MPLITAKQLMFHFWKSIVGVSAGLLLLTLTGPANADDRKGTDETVFTVRFVDEQRRPVVGVQAAWVYGLDQTIPQGGSFEDSQTSDDAGIVRLRLRDPRKYPRPLYARHVERKLVAVGQIIAKEPNQQSDIVNVTMFPECRVTLRAACRQLEERNRRPTKGMALYASQNSILPFIAFLDRTASSCDLILPPGTFKFETYVKGSHTVYTDVEVSADKRQIDLGIIDHEPTQLALLEGLPAPELPPGLVWRNSLPLTLKQLRGKVILLEFWGWWCGPCVNHSIPEMMRIQEEYSGRDLAIIGVHIDRKENEVDTADKLDAKLQIVRQKRWQGRDISFPVVLVPNKRVPFGKNIPGEALNELAATYGIDGYPTTVLIDKQGNVAGEFLGSVPEHREKLKRLIDAQ